MSYRIGIRRFFVVMLLASLAAALVLLDATRAEVTAGKRYALLVGVRAYDHKKLDDLNNTENDVVELSTVLSSFTEIVLLTSTRGKENAKEAPTAANIRAHLKRLLKKVTKHDTILVALAGHGMQLKVKVKEKEIDVLAENLLK